MSHNATEDGTTDEQTDDQELGDFETSADTIAKDEDAVDEQEDVGGERVQPEPVDPLADDFRLGDPAIDTATGRSVVIVDRAADRTDDHSDAEGYDFLDNYGNQRTRAKAADPVYTAVYVSSVQSRPSKSYDFPSSRLARPEYENVAGVDRVYEMVARDLLERLFRGATGVGVDALSAESTVDAMERIAHEAGVDYDVVDEARELADVAEKFGEVDDE